MRRCEPMWPLVLVPKLLSGSFEQAHRTRSFWKVREYGVCVLITHLDRRKEQEHPTSFVEVIVIIKNDESKAKK